MLPIPMHLGQPHAGTDLSPAMLQTFGLFDVLEENGWKYVKSENLCDPSRYYCDPTPEDSAFKAHNCRNIGLACQSIEKRVYEHAVTDNFLLIIGGDHSIPIGTLPAITRARPNTGVVWVDAHADINTPETSGSGNIHGMVAISPLLSFHFPCSSASRIPPRLSEKCQFTSLIFLLQAMPGAS